MAYRDDILFSLKGRETLSSLALRISSIREWESSLSKHPYPQCFTVYAEANGSRVPYTIVPTKNGARVFTIRTSDLRLRAYRLNRRRRALQVASTCEPTFHTTLLALVIYARPNMSALVRTIGRCSCCVLLWMRYCKLSCTQQICILARAFFFHNRRQDCDRQKSFMN